MRAVFNIARNEIRLAMHNKLIFLFLLFSLMIIPLMNVFNFFNIAEEMKILKDFTFSLISIMGIIVCIFYPILSLKEDFEKKYIFNILSKPLSRFIYICGKYLGACLIISILCILNFVLLYTLLKIKGIGIQADEIKAYLILLVKFYLLISISVFLGTLTFSFQVSSMMAIFIYIVGTIKIFVLTALRYTEDYSPAKFLEFFLKIFPNFQFFDVYESVISGAKLTGDQFGRLLGYGISYIFFFLLVTWISVRRKEI